MGKFFNLYSLSRSLRLGHCFLCYEIVWIENPVFCGTDLFCDLWTWALNL